MASSDEQYQLCLVVVKEQLQKRNWRLITEQELAQIVSARLNDEHDITAAEIGRIAINAYSKILFQTCQLEPTPEHVARLAQAFTEIGQYLYDIAYHKRGDRPEDVKDATQIALLNIFQALRAGKLNNPDTFLSGCIWQLRAALTSIDRSGQLGGKGILPLIQEQLLIESHSETNASTSLQQGETAPDPAQLQQALVDELRRKFERHPRARQQFEAVLRKYLDNSDNTAIAEAVGVGSPGAVSNLIVRGKKKLAANQELRELYLQWFSEGV